MYSAYNGAFFKHGKHGKRGSEHCDAQSLSDKICRSESATPRVIKAWLKE